MLEGILLEVEQRICPGNCSGSRRYRGPLSISILFFCTLLGATASPYFASRLLAFHAESGGPID